MASGDEYRFAMADPMAIAPRQLTQLWLLDPPGEHPHAHVEDGGVHVDTEGWFEVLLRVAWSTGDTGGTRFSHTRIPDQEPLHSEAIAADVLTQISQGEQKLRGNSLFGPDRTTCLVLEVWHDALAPIDVLEAELIIRELHVPWNSGRCGGLLRAV
jgi:hypothetical protein